MKTRLLGRRAAIGGVGIAMVGGLVAGIPSSASASASAAAFETESGTSAQLATASTARVVARANVKMRIWPKANRMVVRGSVKDLTDGRDKVAARLWIQGYNVKTKRWVFVKWSPWKSANDYVAVSIPKRACANTAYYRAIIQWKWKKRWGKSAVTTVGRC